MGWEDIEWQDQDSKPRSTESLVGALPTKLSGTRELHDQTGYFTSAKMDFDFNPNQDPYFFHHVLYGAMTNPWKWQVN